MDNVLENAILLMSGISLLIVSIVIILYAIGRFLLFRKCNEKGWKAFIPFYSTYVLYCEICGLHWAWFVATLVVDYLSISSNIVYLLNLFVKAMAFYNLAKRCNKDPIPAMIFGGIAMPIMTLIYALSNINYDPSIEVKQSGLF